LTQPLLNVIFASEKRKIALLLLQDGPKEMEFFLSSLNTTRQALLPQMKVLEENYLITHYKDTYHLTNIGKVVVDEMIPLLNTISVFDSDIDYWGNHNLDFIPSFLLERIGELKSCKNRIPPLQYAYEVDRKFAETSLRSSFVYGVTSVFHPNFTEVYTSLVDSGAQVSTIITKELFQDLKTNNYDEFKNLINLGKINFFVYSNPVQIIFFALNDVSIIFTLLTIENEWDHKTLSCLGQESINWGRELFEYYLRDSTPITEI